MHINVSVTVKNVGEISLIRWRKGGRIWRVQLLFHCFLCVRIETDQLLCVICWVINHSLSVSCKKINHSCSTLVIWSTLQLTYKQWFITQQITAQADLFLKYHILIGKYVKCTILHFTVMIAIVMKIDTVQPTYMIIWHFMSLSTFII